MKQLQFLVYFWLIVHPNLLFSQDLITQVCEILKPNVVGVKATFADGSDQSGFGFITGEEDGKLYLATAAHVVHGLDIGNLPKNIKVKFLSDTKWIEANLILNWEEEDLALLELNKPGFVKWRNDCFDFAPKSLQKTRFIGVNGNEPKWVYPGSGEIFDLSDPQKIHFTIGTIRPGSSGAPLIGEKGILGLILEDDSGTSTALRISRIKELFSRSGQHSYFGVKQGNKMTSGNLLKRKNEVSKNSFEEEYELVHIKSKSFILGCESKIWEDCAENEKPAHQITLEDFSIGKFEVTQKQWRTIMGVDPPELTFKGCDQCPVEGVSWDDIQFFLQKLNYQTGKTYRLPTEAEWEYAARGGNLSKGYKYSGSSIIDEVAWYGSNSGNKTQHVGWKNPNELGLFDMSGNVWEWCQDLYGQYPNNNPGIQISKNPSRVLRGGGWGFGAVDCKVFDRTSDYSNTRSGSTGFRLAL